MLYRVWNGGIDAAFGYEFVDDVALVLEGGVNAGGGGF